MLSLHHDLFEQLNYLVFVHCQVSYLPTSHNPLQIYFCLVLNISIDLTTSYINEKYHV